MLYIDCKGENGTASTGAYVPARNMAEAIENAMASTGARIVTLQADGHELEEIIEALRGVK